MVLYFVELDFKLLLLQDMPLKLIKRSGKTLDFFIRHHAAFFIGKDFFLVALVLLDFLDLFQTQCPVGIQIREILLTHNIDIVSENRVLSGFEFVNQTVLLL